MSEERPGLYDLALRVVVSLMLVVAVVGFVLWVGLRIREAGGVGDAGVASRAPDGGAATGPQLVGTAPASADTAPRPAAAGREVAAGGPAAPAAPDVDAGALSAG